VWNNKVTWKSYRKRLAKTPARARSELKTNKRATPTSRKAHPERRKPTKKLARQLFSPEATPTQTERKETANEQETLSRNMDATSRKRNSDAQSRAHQQLTNRSLYETYQQSQTVLVRRSLTHGALFSPMPATCTSTPPPMIIPTTSTFESFHFLIFVFEYFKSFIVVVTLLKYLTINR
jgi:hypothetical protein